jgi:hypothetical protein
MRFRLRRAASVDFQVIAHRGAGEAGTRTEVIAYDVYSLGAGRHTVSWQPPPGTPAGTFVFRLTASDRSGRTIAYREGTPGRRPLRRAPVLRLVDVDAAFARRSYLPGEKAVLVLATAPAVVRVQILRSGGEADPTYANDELKGVPVLDLPPINWTAQPGEAAPVDLTVGDWSSGLYTARIDTDDGRTGFAPFVVRPARPSARVAVVLPTNTWQAYNFYDADGDGFGDSWYVAQAITDVDLTRPHLNRGVPFRFRSYDLAFLRWLAHGGREVDFYADDDLELFTTGDRLRAAYDLVVFPGHEEYVTTGVYDIVERYRDLGGNLLFLSANNFFRRVDRDGDRLRVVGLWRELGRPEAALCGNQYRASDRGQRRGAYVVTGADLAPWAFAGTGLGNGSTFGLYGIEIDATSAASPPGTQVLARIPDLFGPGRSAEMTYYESDAGARVFSAGALNFGGHIALWPETLRLLENVWARLAPSAPVSSG